MQHPLRHFFSHRLPRAGHVSCVRKGKTPPRPARRGSRTLQITRLIADPALVDDFSCANCGSNLVAASDLLHAPVIPPNRHCPTAGAAEAALVGVAVVTAVMTPTGSASVKSNPAGAYVHI